MAQRLIAASQQYQVEVTTLWTGMPGPAVWNFIEGPNTIGLVPPQYRVQRVAALKAGADFAVRVGVSSITTHVGFIPENPSDPLYPGVIEALKDVVTYCKQRNLTFCFETGQETPVTLLRVIEDLGGENLGINLDPANLLLYGKANPVDALDVIGAYVRGVHAKDGEYPTNGRYLGEEKPLGAGRVNFPVLVPKLKSLGFAGALTIEREISGPKQIEDIKHAIQLLTPLL
jgi:sugar phosphate isomerase/epimerase